MQSITWRAFCVSNTYTKSVVHFFPFAANSTAPYAVNCTLSIFGNGLKRRSVTLEGARIGQPDGVRLDHVFEEIQQGISGLVGLDIELSAGQQRVDLSASSCVIELISGKNSSVRYYARQIGQAGSRSIKPMALLNDPTCTHSVVAINGSAAQVQPGFYLEGANTPAESESEVRIELAEMQPDSLSEISLKQSAGSIYRRLDQGEGVQRFYSDELNSDLAVYALLRDANNNSPMSVYAL